jgi:hypothetical protein
MEVLKMLKERPSLKLVVQSGEGMEPADLLRHPQVEKASLEDLSLKDIELVMAPAWCESYPPEIPRAAAMGIPMVATRKACGFVDLSTAGQEVPPGDSVALGKAVDLLLSKPKRSKVLPEETASVFAATLRNLF